jgi:hypothetical protein
MGTCTVEVEAPCGKKMQIQIEEGTEGYPEAACMESPEDNCMTYTLYHYAATHYNNPR